ncbi:hypothetical protein LCGC14_0477850 [marine sediment metagenome]|uniref:Uncharacterized protein n=1 Tax=marine sediment metagenome TaxID=412755 RepID=A0A0F9SFP2_9ZZZZ
MTKSKDKQIRELEEKELEWKLMFFVATGFFIIFLSLWVFDIQAHPEFEAQLQSCQEKVPVWTLKVECNYSPFVNSKSAFIYTEINFTDHQDYLESLEAVEAGESGENCEVLE